MIIWPLPSFTRRWMLHYRIIPLTSGFHPGIVFPPRGHLAKSGDIFGCLTGGCYWHLGVKAVGTTNHLTMLKTAPNNHG